MTTDNTTPDDLAQTLRVTVNHDAKAQLTNSRGFAQEIAAIAEQLRQASATTDPANSPTLKKLIDDDLIPVTELLTLSIDKLGRLFETVQEQTEAIVKATSADRPSKP